MHLLQHGAYACRLLTHLYFLVGRQPSLPLSHRRPTAAVGERIAAGTICAGAGRLEDLASQLFTASLAEGTRRSYASAQKRFIDFCSHRGFTPLPLSEDKACLFVAYLASQGLSAQTITGYLSALRFFQIAAGLGTPPLSQWQHLHYTVRGIKRMHPKSARPIRLPITPEILLQFSKLWSAGHVESPYMAHLLWAGCCLGFFGFLRSGEFTATCTSLAPSIRLSDVVVDDHLAPSVIQIFLRRAKTDPFGKGVCIILGKTDTALCPVVAVLNYLRVRPSGDSESPLLVLQDGRPLTKALFVSKVRRALSLLGINQKEYAGHSFWIKAAMAAAAAGVPAHLIKTLGRWSSEAYTLYIRESRSTLAEVSRTLVNSTPK